ncbi:PEP-CTERM sorting domain-containing protein [Pseudoduganella chitinolytica]|uniref:PEP-CTERM sorting domain-containing protein n=1 Tax=Pseudoduganella chitinolytica TaxID=34070 RepID=A0ABY8BJ74_9BURK|nr:PEP-CTERM sorting domain-containing protein [Pseudoduganella chitinolytica]WEF35448.1 PEP-CTERM sorting domain-containing protein [Pseudoduganella chitinolytica]
MLRHLCAALLAGACAAAQAGDTWTFTYTGFHDTGDDVFLPDHQLHGSFTGADGNGDGILERLEITSLILNGKDFVACEPDSNLYYRCGAEAFSYSLAGGLSFKAGEHGSDPEGWVGGGHYYISGDGEYTYSYRPSHDEQRAWLWTDRTGLVVASPNPEPETWAMLAAGLAMTAWAARRRAPHRAPGQD